MLPTTLATSGWASRRPAPNEEDEGKAFLGCEMGLWEAGQLVRAPHRSITQFSCSAIILSV